MPKDFFCSRWHFSDGEASIKSFAKEMMSVAHVLRLFIHMVLMASEHLKQHYTCFLELVLILDICSLGDVALQARDGAEGVENAHQAVKLPPHMPRDDPDVIREGFVHLVL